MSLYFSGCGFSLPHAHDVPDVYSVPVDTSVCVCPRHGSVPGNISGLACYRFTFGVLQRTGCVAVLSALGGVCVRPVYSFTTFRFI
jgi:hypothetical protein